MWLANKYFDFKDYKFIIVYLLDFATELFKYIFFNKTELLTKQLLKLIFWYRILNPIITNLISIQQKVIFYRFFTIKQIVVQMESTDFTDWILWLSQDFFCFHCWHLKWLDM